MAGPSVLPVEEKVGVVLAVLAGELTVAEPAHPARTASENAASSH